MPRMIQEGDCQRQHDQNLCAAEKCRGAHRELHAVVGEKPDYDERRNRKDPPGDVNPEATLQRVGKKVSKKPAARRWTENVINQIAPGSDKSYAAAESTRGKGIISAARRHVARELCNRIGDEEANNRGQEERDRHVRACFGRNDGEREDHICRWGDVGNAVEDELRQSKGVTPELRSSASDPSIQKRILRL